MSYKVKVEDSKYTQYEYLDAKTLKKSEKEYVSFTPYGERMACYQMFYPFFVNVFFKLFSL